jgi:prephenate dehydrogenase
MSRQPHIERVAIVGVGLIGASFGLALRKAGFAGSIAGVSSLRSIAAGKDRGAIDAGISLEEAAASADLIFLSQPIHGIIETLKQFEVLAPRRPVVTDAGSTKVAIENAARAYLRDCPFVGGHPMAGKEQRGAEAADADLFQGRPWILTSFRDHPIEVEFRDWIKKFGARILMKDAATHDRLVAWSSHLPQLASTALAAALHDHQPLAASVAGPGLADMTRLALSSYDLWRDIVETNHTEIAAALNAYIGKLQNLRANLDAEFEAGADFAQNIRRP